MKAAELRAISAAALPGSDETNIRGLVQQLKDKCRRRAKAGYEEMYVGATEMWHIPTRQRRAVVKAFEDDGCRVTITADNLIISWEEILDEKPPGAQMNAATARARANKAAEGGGWREAADRLEVKIRQAIEVATARAGYDCYIPFKLLNEAPSLARERVQVAIEADLYRWSPGPNGGVMISW
jgi:hypothetical protein